MSGGRSGFGGVTVREALDSAVIAIGAARSETPRLDAELLLAGALGVDRVTLFTDPGREVTGPAVRAFQDAVRRRSVLREPVAYILGVRGFRHIDLHVDGRVLIPRPETELLVELGLTIAHGARVVDVGTGSGAIALALKQERPDLTVTATDASTGALEVARTNAAALGLQVTFAEGDLLAGVGECDAILSNPPYVADGERASLAAEIVQHEPAGALFAGEDGLDVIRRLVPAAAVALTAGGLLAIEHGAGQAAAVRALLERDGFEGVGSHRDLAGIERVSAGRRPASPDAALGPADAAAFERCIAAGGVALFPADTVYGLACDPSSPAAMRRLYELKGRPQDKPSAVMFFSLEAALEALPELGHRTRRALAALLPGGVTLLLRNPERRFAPACGPDPETLGLRVPALPPRLAALVAVGVPIAQSSANLSGCPEARTLEDVVLRDVADLVLDGGPLPGVASTVVDLRDYERGGWRVLRAGAVGAQELAACFRSLA